MLILLSFTDTSNGKRTQYKYQAMHRIYQRFCQLIDGIVSYPQFWHNHPGIMIDTTSTSTMAHAAGATADVSWQEEEKWLTQSYDEHDTYGGDNDYEEAEDDASTAVLRAYLQGVC